MFCPNCNYECEAHDRFCSQCGTPLFRQIAEEKGRHWVPILFMLLVFAFGTALFFVLPGHSAGNDRLTDGSMPWFSIDEGILSFNEAYYNGNGELQVPESIGGVTVTALADGCFEDCTGLTSIVLPGSLQAIGEDAFKGCSSLRGIEIPESVILIGEGAFSGCGALEAVCVYDGIRSIGTGAFNGCAKLFYIYYSGYFQDWSKLYGEYINPYSTVIAQDGTFYQGEMTN